MTYKLKFKKVGREKFNKTFLIKIPPFRDERVERKYAEEIAEKEVRKHLLSSNVELVPSKKKDNYLVFAGFHKVGEVEIKKGKRGKDE